MRVAQRVHEVSRLEAAHLRDHQGKQGIGGNIEGYAEENIRAALVKLARQFSISHIKLEEGVAGRQRHLVQLAHVPGGNNQAARIGIAFDLRNDIGNLVDLWPTSATACRTPAPDCRFRQPIRPRC